MIHCEEDLRRLSSFGRQLSFSLPVVFCGIHPMLDSSSVSRGILIPPYTPQRLCQAYLVMIYEISPWYDMNEYAGVS